MAYQVGASSGNMIDAKTFFGFYPRSHPVPGERVVTHASTVVYRGYRKSNWNFGWLELDTYRKALAVLCGTAGTGTISCLTTEAGDTGGQLATWVINGVTTANSNAGVLYWTLTDAAGTRTVKLYKDVAHTQEVASGSRAGNGSVTLAASGGSGISGSVIVTYSGDDTDAGNTLTVSFTSLVGSGTAFDTELEIGTVLAIDLGSGVYEIVTAATIVDTDEMTVSEGVSTSFTAKSFLYRLANVYSAACYVTTRDDLDCYQKWQAVCVMPEPDKLERAGEKYLDVNILFTLIGVV